MTALTKKTLDKLGGFDMDYTMGACFDDTDLIYRIMNVDKLNIISPKGCMGVHQYHLKDPDNTAYTPFHTLLNRYIFYVKCKYFEKYGKWMHFYKMDKDRIDIVLNKIGLI